VWGHVYCIGSSHTQPHESNDYSSHIKGSTWHTKVHISKLQTYGLHTFSLAANILSTILGKIQESPNGQNTKFLSVKYCKKTDYLTSKIMDVVFCHIWIWQICSNYIDKPSAFWPFPWSRSIFLLVHFLVVITMYSPTFSSII
jgi:hypothetical protein